MSGTNYRILTFLWYKYFVSYDTLLCPSLFRQNFVFSPVVFTFPNVLFHLLQRSIIFFYCLYTFYSSVHIFNFLVFQVVVLLSFRSFSFSSGSFFLILMSSSVVSIVQSCKCLNLQYL